jgi:hypothetical protein
VPRALQPLGSSRRPLPVDRNRSECYLDAVAAQLRRRRYDLLLPTHEQAFLFAAMRSRLPDDVGQAVSAPDAFARVQSKVAFAAG